MGIMYQPDSCVFPIETTSECLTGFGAEKTSQTGANWRGTDAFPLYTWLDCGLVGLGTTEAEAMAELKRRTLHAHNENVEHTVETIFWRGSLFNPNVQHLAENTPIIEVSGGSEVVIQTAASVITGTYDVVEGIGLLEEAGNDAYSGRLMLHMPEVLVAHMAANHLIETRGSVIYTKTGSIVVPAPGYLRTGPDGTTPANATWVYATGQVMWLESEIIWHAREARQILNRSINDTVLIAEQWFALGWDCAHYALQISTGGVITGTPASAT